MQFELWGQLYIVCAYRCQLHFSNFKLETFTNASGNILSWINSLLYFSFCKCYWICCFTINPFIAYYFGYFNCELHCGRIVFMNTNFYKNASTVYLSYTLWLNCDLRFICVCVTLMRSNTGHEWWKAWPI